MVESHEVMPTVIIDGPFQLVFYSSDGHEPVHIHVLLDGGSRAAKFWISPVRLASNKGLKVHELSKAKKVVEKHENLIKEKWNEFFK